MTGGPLARFAKSALAKGPRGGSNGDDGKNDGSASGSKERRVGVADTERSHERAPRKRASLPSELTIRTPLNRRSDRVEPAASLEPFVVESSRSAPNLHDGRTHKVLQRARSVLTPQYHLTPEAVAEEVDPYAPSTTVQLHNETDIGPRQKYTLTTPGDLKSYWKKRRKTEGTKHPVVRISRGPLLSTEARASARRNEGENSICASVSSHAHSAQDRSPVSSGVAHHTSQSTSMSSTNTIALEKQKRASVRYGTISPSRGQTSANHPLPKQDVHSAKSPPSNADSEGSVVRTIDLSDSALAKLWESIPEK